jgi:hypothetical protein
MASLWTHLTDRQRVGDGLMQGILSAVAAVAEAGASLSLPILPGMATLRVDDQQQTGR